MNANKIAHDLRGSLETRLDSLYNMIYQLECKVGTNMMEQRCTTETDGMMNPGRSKLTAFLTLTVSLLSLLTCIVSISVSGIYGQLLTTGRLTEFLRVGSIAQDIIFIPLALVLMLLSVKFILKPGYKTLITMIGLTGNFLYGYGLYAMQGQYTSLYLVYLAIFSLSVYSIVLGLLSFNRDFTRATQLTKGTQAVIGVFLYFIPAVLGMVWIMRLSPDIRVHVPQATYGVYVLDLCLVFPALAVTATMLFRKKAYGVIFAGAALMKVLTVCLSWGFGELYARIAGVIQGNYGMLALPSFLSLVSLVLFILYIMNLQANGKTAQS